MKRFFCIIFTIFLISGVYVTYTMATMQNAPADVGNFSNDNDWGDDGGRSNDNVWNNDNRWNDDNRWNNNNYSSSSSSDGDFSLGTFVIIIIVVIILIIYIIVKSGGNSRNSGNSGNTTCSDGNSTNVQTLQFSQLDELKKRDSNFSEQRILDMVGNLYVQMQNNWQNKKWESMRTWMTDSLYNQLGRQLDELIMNNSTNYVERISVMDSKITGYEQAGGMDVLIVRLTARITDYTLEDDTGNLVNGSRTQAKRITYDWKLVRRAGRTTQMGAASGSTSTQCPSCGAALDIRYSGKCEYCGAVITLSDYDWVLSSITGISQRTE